MFHRYADGKNLCWSLRPDREEMAKGSLYAIRQALSLERANPPFYPSFGGKNKERFLGRYNINEDAAPLGYGSTVADVLRPTSLFAVYCELPPIEGRFWVCKKAGDETDTRLLQVCFLGGDVEVHRLDALRAGTSKKARSAFAKNKNVIDQLVASKIAGQNPSYFSDSSVFVFYGRGGAASARKVEVLMPDDSAIIVQRGDLNILYATPKAQALGVYAKRTFESLANIPA